MLPGRLRSGGCFLGGDCMLRRDMGCYIKSEQKDQIKADKEQIEEILKIKEESARCFKIVVRLLVALIVLMGVSEGD